MKLGLALLSLLVACSTSASGWRARVWSTPPADPTARPLVVPIPAGQDGTQLVLGVLGMAKQLDASVSGLEIQIGSCARSVLPASVVAEAPTPQPPMTDIVLVRAREGAFRCKRTTEQLILYPKEGLGETKIETTDACEHVPLDHVVLRYRYEIDHGFAPPDLDEVERWMGTRLAFSAPRCGLPPRTEMRARFHGPQLVDPPVAAAAQVATRPHELRAAFLEASRRAEAAAQAGRPDDATRLALAALAMLEVTDLAPVDDTLAHWLAAARYYSVEADVTAVAARLTPEAVDQAWATRVGSEIDALARSYEQIGDFVRHPKAATWLRAGGVRLAKLHARVAAILEDAGYDKPARAARLRARALDPGFAAQPPPR